MNKIIALLLLLSFGCKTNDNIGQTKISSMLIPISEYGAIADDNIDDSSAFQKALDAGNLYLDGGRYIINKSLFIKKNGTRVHSANASQIIFKGSGTLFSSERTNGNYPVNCIFENISITLSKDNSVGIDVKFSYSSFSMLRIKLSGRNCVGLRLLGDEKGTGPYYNIFQHCSIQGGSNAKANKNQIGIHFVPAKNNRSANANTFTGGRIGQVEKGIVINGVGNTFYSPVLEGVKEVCFDFEHPQSNVGCGINTIYSPYIEGSKGVIVTRFGQYASACQVLNPYITSIGKEGKIMQDNSRKKNNGVILSKKLSKGYSEDN